MVSIKDDTRRTLNLTLWPWSLHISNILQQKRRHLRPLWWSPSSCSLHLYVISTILAPDERYRDLRCRFWQCLEEFESYVVYSTITHVPSTLVICFVLLNIPAATPGPLCWPFGIIPTSQKNRCHLLNHSTYYQQQVHFRWNKTSMHPSNPRTFRTHSSQSILSPVCFPPKETHDTIPKPPPTP